MYDEIEYFKNYQNPEFFYPYQLRKTNLGSYIFNTFKDGYEYEWVSKTVSLQASEVCMELVPYNLHSEFQDSLQETIDSWTSNEEDEEDSEKQPSEFLSECLAESFSKLKYVSNRDVSKNYLNFYEEELIDDVILFEMVL